jgi:hypothetical protein
MDSVSNIGRNRKVDTLSKIHEFNGARIPSEFVGFRQTGCQVGELRNGVAFFFLLLYTPEPSWIFGPAYVSVISFS